MKAPRDSSAADRRDLHREKMRNKAGRRDRWHTDANARLERARRYAPAPKARSIWPKGKVAKPGRMG